MVRVYLELSILISLANPPDLFHIQTRNFMDELRTFGFEAVILQAGCGDGFSDWAH
ncbi:MAG: hypothetical protein QXH51_00745 [Candidatus Bathyarchaeia archaeon]